MIAKNGTPLVRLVPYHRKGEVRELGFARGRIKVSDDFDAPLPPDLLEEFDAGSA